MRDVHLIADIVNGMSCFDHHFLVSLPMEQVSFCFTALFQTFCLRGCVQRASESDYRDEYMEFVEYSRTSFLHLKDQPGLVKDVVGFLIVLPALRSRKNLFYLFRLSCLCLTESGTGLPPIKFHEVDTSNPKCRLIDMLLPAKSYLANCPGAFFLCTSEPSMSKLRAMDEQINSGQFAGDPWAHVDTFGRSTLLQSLTTTFKGLKSTPGKVVTLPSRSSSVSSTVGRTVLHGSGRAHKLAFFGSISPSETSQAVKN